MKRGNVILWLLHYREGFRDGQLSGGLFLLLSYLLLLVCSLPAVLFEQLGKPGFDEGSEALVE